MYLAHRYLTDVAQFTFLASVYKCLYVLDVNRDAAIQRVEGENSNIIGIVWAVIMSTALIIVLILDFASIKQSLQLLRKNLRCSDKQRKPNR